MADIQYDVNLDALKEAASKTPAFDVYNPTDFYVNTSVLPSTADEHLPSVAIEGITPSFDQETQDEKFNALIKQLLSEKSPNNFVAGGAKDGAMTFSENADGTYSHTVERGDSYWKVAREVVMSQKGTDNPGDVSNGEVQKMMAALIAFNEKNAQSADHLAIGEQIHIPKEIANAVEAAQSVAANDAATAAALESAEAKPLTADERKELDTTSNGIQIADMKLNPIDGVYNPLQPPGLEQGQNGDYDTEGFYNYDVEGRETLSDVTNKFTGMRTLAYKGQIDSGFGANGIWWNDTPFAATENINANGVMTYRHIDYQDSSVKMNFDDGTGKAVTTYVRSVESELNPSSGNYTSRITTADGKVYSMQVNGQTGQVIADSVKVNGGS